MGSVVTVCSWIYRGEEIRYSRARVQHSKQISRGDSLPLGDSQQFDDGTFYNFSVRLYGLSSVNHCSRCKGLHLNKIAGPDVSFSISRSGCVRSFAIKSSNLEPSGRTILACAKTATTNDS